MSDLWLWWHKLRGKHIFDVVKVPAPKWQYPLLSYSMPCIIKYFYMAFTEKESCILLLFLQINLYISYNVLLCRIRDIFMLMGYKMGTKNTLTEFWKVPVRWGIIETVNRWLKEQGVISPDKAVCCCHDPVFMNQSSPARMEESGHGLSVWPNL